MNQLTVMLNNGNVGAGAAQGGAQPGTAGTQGGAPTAAAATGFVTFQSAPGQAGLTLDPNNQVLSFQPAPQSQPGTTFLLNANQQPQGFLSQAPPPQAGHIQYIINSQPNLAQAQTQQTFGRLNSSCVICLPS